MKKRERWRERREGERKRRENGGEKDIEERKRERVNNDNNNSYYQFTIVTLFSFMHFVKISWLTLSKVLESLKIKEVIFSLSILLYISSVPIREAISVESLYRNPC